MPKIFIKEQNRNIEYVHGDNLLEILLENEIFVDNPCNGKGLCGKCKVRLLEGNLPTMIDAEEKFLKIEEINSGVRLSCLVVPTEDITIELMQKERKHEVLTTGYMPKFQYKPSIRKEVFELKKPTLDNQISFETPYVVPLVLESWICGYCSSIELLMKKLQGFLIVKT